MTPADAEYNFLMKAKDLDYYGIELFQAQVIKSNSVLLVYHVLCDIMWCSSHVTSCDVVVLWYHVIQ